MKKVPGIKITQEILEKFIDVPYGSVKRERKSLNLNIVYELEMADEVARKTGFLRADVKTIIQVYCETIAEKVLEKNQVIIRGVGTIRPKPFKARNAAHFVKEEGADFATIRGRQLVMPKFSPNFLPTKTFRENIKKIPMTIQELKELYNQK